jgi:hypothetical protein
MLSRLEWAARERMRLNVIAPAQIIHHRPLPQRHPHEIGRSRHHMRCHGRGEEEKSGNFREPREVVNSLLSSIVVIAT